MIPLGVVGSAHKVTAGGGTLTATYQTATGSGSNSATYSFPDLPIGAVDATRIVVATLHARKAAPSPTLSSFTIGGVAATVVATAGASSGNLTVVGYAAVPTGTTATVAVTYSATVLRAGVGVWTITGGVASTTGYTNTDVGSAAVDIAVPAGGVAITAVTGTNNGSVVWTNANGRFDSPIGAESATQSGADTSTAGASTVTVTGTGITDMTLAAAAFAPA